MDGDWQQVASIPFPPPGKFALPTPITAMTFDSIQELLWTGNEYGRVTSFYSTELSSYTSFKVNTSKTQEGSSVRQILVNEKGIIGLSPKDIHMSIRRGLPLWHLKHDDFKDLRCMSFTSKGTNEILVAGFQESMLVVDVAKGQVVKQIPTEHQYVIMKRSRYICAATPSGVVHLLNPTNYTVLKTWNAHTAGISDMDAQHDYIVTCGFSLRQGQTYMLDPFVNVFDIKKMASTPPIPFPAGAAYVRMHPRMSTTSIVMSQNGQVHIVDLVNPNASNVRQASITTYLTMFEIAPSGEAIAMADGGTTINLWGSPAKIHFVDYPTPVEFADPDESLSAPEWHPDAPLNSIGMPYYRDALASAWPDFISDVGAPPVELDPRFLAALSPAEFGLYGRNTRGLHRNQAQNTRQSDRTSSSGLRPPKFLSEKARDSAKGSASPMASSDSVSEISSHLSSLELDSSKLGMPVMYQHVEMKYSKFGIDDFDFGYYNSTAYSGLEIHIPNSYANSLLQLLHFTPVVRNLALRHTGTACLSDTCLLCELGFLFDMLQKAEGSICQASNMLKALGQNSQAAALGLLEEDNRGYSLTHVLQRLARFLLDKIAGDYRTNSVVPLMDQVLSTAATSSIRCMSCGSEYTRPGSTNVNDLVYPANKPPTRNQKAPRMTFSQVLKASVERETSKGWCRKCMRYQSLSTHKTIHDIPAVLMLNAAIQTTEHKRLWATPGWLPEEIGIIVDQGQFFCYEGEDLKLHLQRAIHNVTVYSLVGMVINIEGEETQKPNKPHMVAAINVAHAEPTPPSDPQWHLFNDFLVCAIPAAEALKFNSTWKTPSVLCYQMKQANNKIDNDWKKSIDTSILYHDINPSNEIKTYRLLDPAMEAPGPHTIIAIDAEFVSIRRPEIEINSDGVRETVRPTSFALARASVVRGQGEEEGLPFIDDYISIREPIVDYLTSYSGITHADLDARTTRHNLLPLKVAYKKLWILLNLGCRFLGHGLRQDFRVINIHIPKAQVIDTSELFILKRHLRKLSLAFLAWHLLRENIQLDTHDSIEDARTALKLYRKYQEFEDAGILDAMLLEIYRVGREVNFKPPKVEGERLQRSETPPLPAAGEGNSRSGPGPSTPSSSHRIAVAAETPGAAGMPAGQGPPAFGGGSWTPGRSHQ